LWEIGVYIAKKEGSISTRKAQFSIEYLMMMGFALMLLIPIIVLFASESQNMKSDIAVSQLNQVAMKIADKAEEVYYQGQPSRTTIKVSIPQGVKNITFSNNEIIFNFLNPDNVVLQVEQDTPINVTGNISSNAGIHFIQIESEGEYVLVSET